MAHKHSRPIDGGRAFYLVENLWRAAEGLPVIQVEVEAIPDLDWVCWFDTHKPPTCRAVANHARRIYEADFSYPIILAPDGSLMDGGHRLAKAYLNGITHVDAVQFETLPEPDWIVPDSTEGEA
jgi:hypothetical protein